MAAPKVLFLGRTIAHFSYYDSILAALLERGAEVDYACDEDWSRRWGPGDRSLREFAEHHPGLTTSWSPRRADAHRGRIFPLRELRSFRSYVTRAETTPFYIERWRGYVGEPWKSRLDDARFMAFLTSPAGGKWLRRAEDRTPPDPALVDYLRAKAPDVLVASPTNMRFSEETDFIKAAKALGIPTAVPVLSWDNLSTKGLVQILPDLLLVWNQYQHEDAVGIQEADPAKVRIVGAPFFDKWFASAADLPSRKKLCRRLDFDPASPILLYLGSSRNIAKDESGFVEAVRAQLDRSALKKVRRTQILLRPHPANAEIYRRLQGVPGVRVWPEDGALPETREEFANMRMSFQHADASLGINTSGMIDSVIAGLPTFTVQLPEYAATQADSKHFKYLVQAGAMTVSQDLAGFEDSFGRLLKGEDPKAEARQAFTRAFARPEGLERSAGDVVAQAVLELAGR